MNASEVRIDINANDGASPVFQRLVGNMQEASAGLEKLKGAISSVSNMFGGLGLIMSVGSFEVFTMKAIEAGAEIYRLAERTGVAVESLSALRGSAKLSGTSMDEVAVGLQKLTRNMVESRDGTGKSAEAFKALGVSVIDSNGKLKNADQVMLEVAKSLDQFKDGAGKTDAVMKIFGKSGANLIPMLKELAEKGDLNGKMTTAQAEACYRFEQEVSKMKSAIQAVFFSIAQQLIPVIEALPKLFKPAVELAAAYFAVFVAAPAALSAATTAHAVMTASVAANGSVWKALTGSVSGAVTGMWDSIKAMAGITEGASTATKALGAIKIAAGALMIAFAAWEIGKWLYDNFEWARNGFNAFYVTALKGWEYIKFGAEVAWAGIKSAISTVIEGIGSFYASTLDMVAKGLALVGQRDAAAAVSGFADKIRDATRSSTDFKGAVDQAKGSLSAGLAKVDEMKVKLDEEAAAHFKAGQSARKHSGELDLNASAAGKVSDEYAKLTQASKAHTIELGRQTESGEKLTEGEKRLLDMQTKIEAGTLKYSQAAYKAAAAQFQEEAEAERLKNQMVEAAKATKAAEEASVKHYDATLKATEKINEQIAAQQAANITALTGVDVTKQLEIAKLRDSATTLDRLALYEQDKNLNLEIAQAYRDQAAGLRKLAEEKEKGVHIKAAQDAASEWKKTTDSIYNGLTDSLYRAFESGKGFFQTLWDGIKNTFKTTILKVMVQAVMSPINQGLGALLGSGNAMAGTGAGGGLGSFSSIGSMLSNGWDWAKTDGLGWLTDFGGSVGTAAGKLGGSLFDAGFQDLGNWIGGNSGAIGDFAGMAGDAFGYLGALKAASDGKWGSAIGSGLGTFFGGPIGGALGGAVGGLVDKAFGGDGHDFHGADYVATATGGYRPQEYEVGDRQYGWSITGARSDDLEKALKGVTDASLASLNGLSQMFGGKANYKLGTYFSSNETTRNSQGNIRLWRDGSVIDQLSSQRYATDPKKGFEEYTQDVVASVRSAMSAIQLPEWAKKQIDALGTGATVDQLAKTVQVIQQTKAALEGMGSAFAPLGGVFARIGGLSDEAKLQLAGFAGGIDALVGKTKSFVDLYYSDGEKNAITASAIQKQLSAAGITASIGSKEDFRHLVDSQDISTETGRRQLAALLDVAQAFAPIGDYLKQQGKTLNDLAGQAPQVAAIQSLTQAQAASSEQQLAATQTLNSTMDSVGTRIVGAIGALVSSMADMHSGFVDAVKEQTHTLVAMQEAKG